MMERKSLGATLLTILIWGGLWGTFEATVGYLLHLLPFNLGWLVWYPTACFFMLNVYRNTNRKSSVLLVGLLAACIKLLNLLLPGRIDRVLNPSVSIILESLSMVTVIWAINHFFANRERSISMKVLAVLSINTIWRGLYILYILFLVPEWMRKISVISSTNAFITFFFIHNLFTSSILFIGFVMLKHILTPVKTMEQKLSALFSTFPYERYVSAKVTIAVFLLGISIMLELLL